MSDTNGTSGSVPADIRTNPPAVMTGDEVVALLGLPNSRALNRLVRKGKLSFVDGFGTSRRFLYTSVLDCMRAEERSYKTGGRGGERPGDG